MPSEQTMYNAQERKSARCFSSATLPKTWLLWEDLWGIFQDLPFEWACDTEEVKQR